MTENLRFPQRTVIIKKPVLYLCLALVCSFFQSIAQAPAIQWQNSYGGNLPDVASAIGKTTDGGYIVTGSTNSNNGDVSGHHGTFAGCFSSECSDYWVAKIDATGGILWSQTWGGTRIDQASYVQQTSDGGYFIAGFSTSNDGDVSGWHPGYHSDNTPTSDYWVIKLKADLTLDWKHCYGGSGDDILTSAQQSSDGGYVLAGYSNSMDGDVTGYHFNSNADIWDYWVVKLLPNGSMLWQKTLGGTWDDRAYSVKETADGGFVIAGESQSTDGDITDHHGANIGANTTVDMWVVKLNSSGSAIQWAKSLGGTDQDRANAVLQTANGDYLIAGYTRSSDGDVTGWHGTNNFYFDYWIVKLNSLGNTILWEKALGGTNDESVGAIIQTSSGDYVAAGYSKSNDADASTNYGDRDVWLAKLSDSNGALLWEKNYGGSGSDGATSIRQTTDGGYILSGWEASGDGEVTNHHAPTYFSDFWVVKLGAEPSSGDPACITWDLASSDAVTATTGNLTGQPQTISPGSSAPFMSLFGYNNGQRLWVGTSGWIAGPVDPLRYIEFNTAPLSGNDLIINSVSFNYSDFPSGTDFNIIAFEARYSTDNWTTWTSLGTGTYLGTAAQTFNATVNATVSNGSTFSVRIFPHALQNGLAGTPTFAIHTNVSICGETVPSSGSDTGSICGSKFNDLNGNSTWDDGEPGIAGWQIDLSSDNPTVPPATIFTDSDGHYCFENLAAGLYSVTEAMQDGWQQTTPSDPSFYADGVYYFYLGLSNGQAIPDINFGNMFVSTTDEACITWDLLSSPAVTATTGNLLGQPQTISAGSSAPFMSVYGYNNGQQLWVGNTGWVAGPVDPARYIEFNVSPTSGNNVNLTSLSFDFNDFQTGTDFGIIGFVIEYSTDGWTSAPTNLGGGIYSGTTVQNYALPLNAMVNDGQTFSLRIYPYAIQNGIAMTPTFATHSNVTLCGTTTPSATGSICGTKFNDLNGNGVFDLDEPGLPNWQINLTSADGGNLLATTLTGAAGDYCFENVPAGYFYVSETQQPGWEQTFPETPEHLVGLVDGGIYTDVDFGNKLVETIPEAACVINYLTENPCGGLTTGNVTNDGCTMSLGPEPLMVVSGYDAVFGQSVHVMGGWQSGILEPTRYLAFNIKPNPGYDLTVTTVSFDYRELGLTNNAISGQVDYIVGSGSNWTSSTILGDITYTNLFTPTFTATLNQLVNDGEVFILRIYLWATQSEIAQPFLPTHRNVMMCGETTASLGIETADVMTASIYPNPAAEVFYVRIPGNHYEGAVIVLYDMLGKKILEVPATGEETTLNMAMQQSGMYTVVVNTTTGIKIVKKLVLMR